MHNPLKKLTEELFTFGGPDTAGDRRFFRLFELFVIVEASVLAWAWARYVQQLSGIAHPIGVTNYVDLSFVFRGETVFYVAALMTGLCIVGFLARRFRPAYLLALLLLHLLYVARFSLGKVSHGSNLVGLCLLALALASVFYDDPVLKRRMALGLARFLVGFSYVLAACSKLIGTGLTWPAGSHLQMWIAERGTDVLATTGGSTPNVLQSFLYDHTGWATVVLAGSLLTEALGWTYWFRSSRPFITVALIAMHVGIAIIMHIHFDLNVAVLVLLGFPWPRLWAKSRHVKSLLKTRTV